MIIFSDGTKQTKDLSTVGQRIFIGNDSAIESGSNTGKYDGTWVYTHSQISNLTTLVNQKKLFQQQIKIITQPNHMQFIKNNMI